MAVRLKSLLASWFVLQIVLPFTAPLQTCDLADLFGTAAPHHTITSPESSATPTASEAHSFVSPLAVSTLHAPTAIVDVRQVAVRGPFLSSFDLSPSPQVQQTVLRL